MNRQLLLNPNFIIYCLWCYWFGHRDVTDVILDRFNEETGEFHTIKNYDCKVCRRHLRFEFKGKVTEIKES